MPIVGVGGTSTNISKQTNTTIASLNQTFSANLSFLVLNHITSKIASFSFSKQSITIPNTVELADPDFNIATDIDILIGARRL